MKKLFELEKCVKTADDLFALAVRKTAPLQGVRWRPGPLENLDAPRDTGALTAFEAGGEWGGRDQMAVFALNAEIPADMAGLDVFFELTTGREGGWNANNPQFVAYVDGHLRQGMDVNHTRILLAAGARGGERFELVLEGWSGMYDELCRFRPALVALHAQTQALAWDLRVATDAAKLAQPESLDFAREKQALVAAVNLLDLRGPFSPAYDESVRLAREALEKQFYTALSGHPATVNCIGHTHIDIAWMWRICHTRRKAVRSFATVLELMDRYPDYVFSSSQPVLFNYVKEDAPALYERIRERIAEGRFEAEGGMWVEADCNLISGESMVRQFIYGKRFFKEEFGIDSKMLWLPDVFGYSAAMPQILRKCGVESFVTSKISWNEYNRMPNDTFIWEGIDGTGLLTQFHTIPPEVNTGQPPWYATYVGFVRPKTIAGAWERYQNKDLSDEVFATYGFGDGGGGPDERELEYVQRLAGGLPGVPRTQSGNALGYMERMAERVKDSPNLNRWVGELYLEFHRGTYTSMAKNKRDNRRCEQGLQTVEALICLAKAQGMVAGPSKRELDDTWRQVLTLQFHDILPGSSIAEVYEDSARDYEEILASIAAWTNSLATALAGGCETGGDAQGLAVFNTTGFELVAPVACDAPEGARCAVLGGRALPLQKTADGRSVFLAEGLPPYGAAHVEFTGAPSGAESAMACSDKVLDNGIVKVTLDGNGEIASLWDHRAGRELAASPLNHLVLYEDRPYDFDAWDIPAYFRQKPYALGPANSIRLVENGPVRAVVQVQRSFSNSQLAQRYVLYAGSARVDIETEVDWKESQHLLKAAFPFALKADYATYDIQFGNVRRPTHQNTSWDIARFEVCAHKWADLSENGYGVALLNDSKYGYSALGSTLELSLLKSPVYPSAVADRGKHHFTYSVFPHEGSCCDARLNREAYTINRAPMALPCGGGARVESFVKSDNEALVLDTLKPAENGEGVILRLFEGEGRQVATALAFGVPVQAVYACDLMENNTGVLTLEAGGRLRIAAGPYEILTLRIML